MKKLYKYLSPDVFKSIFCVKDFVELTSTFPKDFNDPYEQRLSYSQIRCPRIWHACGWSIEKIQEKLVGIDGCSPSINQLKSLLDGKTYDTIPHVMAESLDT